MGRVDTICPFLATKATGLWPVELVVGDWHDDLKFEDPTFLLYITEDMFLPHLNPQLIP